MSNKQDTTLLVLAAGLGSRYGGIKQIDGVGPNQEPILEYSVYDAIRAGFTRVVFVIRKKFEEQFKNLIEPKFKDKIHIEYAYQEADVKVESLEIVERTKPWGTGHAILSAKNVINERFAVINADDFYGAESFKVMNEFLCNQCNEKNYSMVGYVLQNTLSENGYVSRGVCGLQKNNMLEKVVEYTEIYKTKNGAEFNDKGSKKTLDTNLLVSMNFWGFHPSIFRELENGFIEFAKENKDNPKAEYFIPSVVTNMLIKNKIQVSVLKSNEKWFGVTYKKDKDIVYNSLKKLIEKGVYPNHLWK